MALASCNTKHNTHLHFISDKVKNCIVPSHSYHTPAVFISITTLPPAAIGNSEPQAYKFLPSTSPDRQGQGNWRPHTIRYITNSTQQSSLWEAMSCWTDQEIPSLFWNAKVHVHFHNGVPQVLFIHSFIHSLVFSL